MTSSGRQIGRYTVFGEFAAGGMARVHLGRLRGAEGFGKTVALKSLAPELARDPDLVAAFVEEAKLTSRIRHPNVVTVSDVIADGDELYLVMDYVHGVSLAALARRARLAGKKIPAAIASAIMVSALDGLGAAHDAKDEGGHVLHLVHRDVSPQNILVGQDGMVRVLDFGIAKTVRQNSATASGARKGKPGYMAPEQLRGENVDARADVWAAAVVLWELLTGSRLFGGDDDWAVARKVMERPIDKPSRIVPGLSEELDCVVLRGLERDRDARFSSAREMAHALEHAVSPARIAEVRGWVDELANDELERLAAMVRDVEQSVTPIAERPARRRGAIYVALLAVAVAVASLVFGATRQRPAPPAADKPAELPSAEPVRVVEPALAAVPSQTAPHASSSPAPASRPRAARAPSVSSVAPAASGAVDCDPPYTVDQEGFHHMKPACLGR